MKKLRLIFAGLLMFGATAVMAQQTDTEDGQQSDQYSTEESQSDTSSVESPSNDATTPAPSDAATDTTSNDAGAPESPTTQPDTAATVPSDRRGAGATGATGDTPPSK